MELLVKRVQDRSSKRLQKATNREKLARTVKELWDKGCLDEAREEKLRAEPSLVSTSSDPYGEAIRATFPEYSVAVHQSPHFQTVRTINNDNGLHMHFVRRPFWRIYMWLSRSVMRATALVSVQRFNRYVETLEALAEVGFCVDHLLATLFLIQEQKEYNLKQAKERDGPLCCVKPWQNESHHYHRKGLPLRSVR